MTRLHEQEQRDHSPLLGSYVRQWLGWARGGVNLNPLAPFKLRPGGVASYGAAALLTIAAADDDRAFAEQALPPGPVQAARK